MLALSSKMYTYNDFNDIFSVFIVFFARFSDVCYMACGRHSVLCAEVFFECVCHV